MKVELINQPRYNNAIYQVLTNRGIENLDKYLKSTMADVNDPSAFGIDIMSQAARVLMAHIAAEDDILIVVDSDCDGMTSSAILTNYLYDLFPSYVDNHVYFFIHSGKQHGLNDCYDTAAKYKLVILPDAGSGDYEYHKRLKDNGTNVICLDHHPVEKISEDAVVINNQMCDYPNKNLSGAGVTFQFCRYLDIISGNRYADNYLDLVALGLDGDMMSMASAETKTLIFEGFKEENIKNPFIYEMIQKNSFPLSKTDYKPSSNNNLQITPMGAAFFIVPLVNAIVRSGTMEEKEIVFKSMLKFKAFEKVMSTKRGHKLGEQERLIDQALRICTNVKNRQTKAETEGIERLEGLIEKKHMLDHKVLLFLLEPGKVDRNIAGLVANRLMAKYQRPVCILTRVEELIPDKNIQEEMITRISYQGSARGYEGSGVLNFKDICAAAPGCVFTAGHQSAFGLTLGYDILGQTDEIAGEYIYQFLDYTDEVLKDMPDEPIYKVDYSWNYDNIDGDKILEISEMNDYIGKDIERPMVYIKNIPVNNDTFKVMKSNTLKYSCPVADIIQFSATDTQIEEFSTGSRIINAVCKCASNEWNFQIDPQLILIDYEVAEIKHDIFSDWGF